MAFCTKCGNELLTKVKFCPECGNEVFDNKKNNKSEEVSKKIKDSIDDILDTTDNTDKFTKKDAKDNMGFSLISYLSLLVLIPYFLGKSSKFVQYHAKQGMNLLVIWAGYIVLYNILNLIKVGEKITYWGNTYISYTETPWWITIPMNALGIGLFVLNVIGIIYVCQGKAKELPIIGKLKIVK